MALKRTKIQFLEVFTPIIEGIEAMKLSVGQYCSNGLFLASAVAHSRY